MGYYDIASHRLTYAAVLAGILYVLIFIIVAMRRAWKRALEIGFSRERLRGIVRSSISCAIVPSTAGLAGFFTLAPLLGIPLSWWRLSIVGSTAYEIMAAEMALNTAGVELSSAGAGEYILVMYVMAIGIIGGMVMLPLFAERVHRGTIRLKQRDVRWGALGNSVFMLAVALVFVIPMILGGGARLLTLITSAAVTLLLAFLCRRFNLSALNDFILAIAMIFAMASSVFWDSLFTG
ncbi:MAG: DUF5058 family protein [Spirochaetaceae bacterium]|jgi:hypothetical protein|nr:DUF5058 family protein [Spirochaetaceae bacterium]